MYRLKRENLVLELFRNVYNTDSYFMLDLRISLVFNEIREIYSGYSKTERKKVLRSSLISPEVKELLRKVSRIGKRFSMKYFLEHTVDLDYKDRFLEDLIKTHTFITSGGTINFYWYAFLSSKTYKGVYFTEFHEFYSVLLYIESGFRDKNIKYSGYEIELALHDKRIVNANLIFLLRLMEAHSRVYEDKPLHKMLYDFIESNYVELNCALNYSNITKTNLDLVSAKGCLEITPKSSCAVDIEYEDRINIIANLIKKIVINITISSYKSKSSYKKFNSICKSLDEMFYDYEIGTKIKEIVMFMDSEVVLIQDTFVTNLLVILRVINDISNYDLDVFMDRLAKMCELDFACVGVLEDNYLK